MLCHDSATKQTTLEALPKIIEYYQDLGYSFEAIDRDSWVCHHVLYSEQNDSTSDDDTSGGESDTTDDAYDESSYTDEEYYDEGYVEEEYVEEEGDY